MKRFQYKKGDWNCICQWCGFKVKASETTVEWDGLRVCKKHSDKRNPQDFVKPIKDRQKVPFTSPESEDVFI